MNIIGESVAILNASDPTVAGRSGRVVLETANTLLLRSEGETFRIQKKGTVLQLSGSKEVVAGEDIPGRLEDRLRSKKA